MTTFKNNSKYAELVFLYLDIANRDDIPLTVPEVLRAFRWNFKGGSLKEAAEKTRLCPETSWDDFPHGSGVDIAREWPDGRQARALRRILAQRSQTSRLRLRGALARVGTYQVLVSGYGISLAPRKIKTGLTSVYYVFSQVWKWSALQSGNKLWDNLLEYSRELLLGSCSPSFVHLPTVESNWKECAAMLSASRVPALLQAVTQVKSLIQMMGSPEARSQAREMGLREREKWMMYQADLAKLGLSDPGMEVRYLTQTIGSVTMRVTQGAAVLGLGEHRHALGKSDAERLHQLLMSAASALVGVCAQACVGTPLQKVKAKRAVIVAEANIERIVESSKRVSQGDEVLVCKGYRRAYTAHLARLAGPLCVGEYRELVQEAVETAPVGVLDVEGFLLDLAGLDAASSLNAAKVFKICPAPDVSPGTAMMDRITQIGNSNVVDPEMMVDFEVELRTQILRAYIRSYQGRLELKDKAMRPDWYGYYLKGEMDKVPSAEIDRFLKWEATGEMPEVSPYDPAHWKDSGLGADTIWETTNKPNMGHKKNMLTRLVFDEECPMPGGMDLSRDHVIKMFIKAEGHKDPARAIFSSNLRDRQAQSWMERGVEQVALKHPSYMIGQEVDVRMARVAELTKPPAGVGMLALYYSFDISGWSAKMPAEPQHISHNIWKTIYGGHLYTRATEINEGAHIYMNLEGYWGWYKNTHSNLEGFNGKEMTMVLIALLSLSVRRWRVKVVEEELMSKQEADSISALLFAYIDDGLSRLDLPKKYAIRAFEIYKLTVIETFSKCGFSVEVSKCFPSDRFAIFLNEVYLAGRHVVHGVRAAMGISAEPTERHTSLVERVTSVATGVRGAVMAGLNPLSGVILMAYHSYMHIIEWVPERDPVLLAIWSLAPRTWGGLGLPNMMQTYVSGSGAAFEEGVATMQAFARINPACKKFFLKLCRTEQVARTPVGVLVAPLSGRVEEGYMVDNRIANMVRRALSGLSEEGRLSSYADRLLRYADSADFETYAEAIIPMGVTEVLQEQMLTNLAESHPHSIFSAFARRLEKSSTVMGIVGSEAFQEIMRRNREEARLSVEMLRLNTLH